MGLGAERGWCKADTVITSLRARTPSSGIEVER
jgi:hypothetical protein